jgi:hypothetical protein
VLRVRDGRGACRRPERFVPKSAARRYVDGRATDLRQLKETPASISDLARKLRRDRSAVTRDVQLLERFGILHVTEKPLPGLARDLQLTAQL